MQSNALVQVPDQDVLIAENRLRTLADLRDDAEGAAEVISSVSRNLHVLNQADVYQRYIFGSQLEIVRDNGLWESIAPVDKTVTSTTWDEWLRNEFREITGFSAETAYGACQIAKARFLQERDEEEIREFGRLTNVRLLARVERQGTPVTEQMINDAKDLSEKEFRQRVGLPENSRRVETIVDNQSSADSLEVLLGIFRSADSDALDEFAATFQRYFREVAGENATDALDGANAALMQEIEVPYSQRAGESFDEIDMLLKGEDNDEYHAR